MYHKTVLDSGVILVTEQIPSRTVSFGIWMDVGTRDEDAQGSGAAHFLEHMLFKGTTRRDASSIARELDRLGGQSNAFTTKENTCLYGTVLDAQLPSLVAILSELFFDSLFPDHEIERERLVILQELGMSLDTPEDLIHDLFAGVMWEGHPMARPTLGQVETISAMDRDCLQAFRRRGYVPNRVLISAAGNVDHHALAGMLSAMNEWRYAAPLGDEVPDRIAPLVLPPQITVSPKRLEQAHILLGIPGPPACTDDRYAISLLNTVLGGNMSSRLFQEVREKRGLAYSIYSFVEGASDCGVVGVYAGVNPESTIEVRGVIQDVIADICKNGISVDELRGAQDFVRAGLFLAEESMEARMMRLAKNEWTFGRHIPIEEADAGVCRVVTNEVTDLAVKLFANPLAGVVLGPVRQEDCRPDSSLTEGSGDD